MSLDRQALEEFFERIADKFTASELVMILEDAGLLDVWTIISLLEEELIEAKEILEV